QGGKVGRGEDGEVLAVLAVEAFDVLSDDELHTGAHFRGGRLLARRSLATALAADRHREAALLDRASGDGELLAALETEVGEFSQGLVVVVADVSGRDFVGGNVVA